MKTNRFLITLLLFALCVGHLGCGPGGAGSAKVEHQRGRSLRELDPEKARDYFLKAVRADPALADAHLDLAYLYEGVLKDPNAAIYHFNRFIALRPDSPLIDSTIRPRIRNCIKDMTIEGDLQIVIQELSADRELLRNEVKRLGERNAKLEAEVKKASEDLARAAERHAAQAGPAGTREEFKSDLWILHEIQPGDTFFSLAGRYGVRAKDIEELNRGVQAGSLKLGSKIRIPKY